MRLTCCADGFCPCLHRPTSVTCRVRLGTSSTAPITQEQQSGRLARPVHGDTHTWVFIPVEIAMWLGLASHLTTISNDPINDPRDAHDIPPASVFYSGGLDRVVVTVNIGRSRRERRFPFSLTRGDGSCRTRPVHYRERTSSISRGWPSGLGFRQRDRPRCGAAIRTPSAFLSGDVETARRINLGLLPLFDAQRALGGVSMSKSALELLGIPAGVPRLPQLPPTDEQRDALAMLLHRAGVIT